MSEGSFCPMRRELVHLNLYSNASLEGWGGTDEVTHVGRDIKFYAFPPFSALSRVLAKIKEDQAYRKSLQNSSLMPGENAPKNNTTQLYKDGEHIVANGKLIPLLPL